MTSHVLCKKVSILIPGDDGANCSDFDLIQTLAIYFASKIEALQAISKNMYCSYLGIELYLPQPIHLRAQEVHHVGHQVWKSGPEIDQANPF